jgi:molecular chaperone DnaK (HSP70)
MSTTARKPPPAGTPGRDAASKPSASPGATPRTPSRTPTPTATANGVGRRGSVRSGANGTPVSARAAVRKPGAPSNLGINSSHADGADDDAREEAAAYAQDLKERLQKAENEALEAKKQIEVLHSRLDDALTEQSKLEERAHEEEEKVEALENAKRELTRQQRELEGIYEAERAQAMREKEETLTKEEELQETIQRLKETMAMKNVATSDNEDGHLSRACKNPTPAPH